MPAGERRSARTMARVALVAPETRLRSVMVETADAGVFEPDPPPGHTGTPHSRNTDVTPRLSARLRPTEELEAEAHHDLLLGELDLRRHTDAARRTDRCALVMGWIPRGELEALRDRLAPIGGGLVELTPPRNALPPTLLPGRSATRALRPIVSTYATLPYRDIDPTWFAALTYMFMFGMMFGDVGHGAALLLLGLAAATRPRGRLSKLTQVAPFLIGAGIASVAFGLLYGEAFGPTGLVPTLWLHPLDEPETLLVAGLVSGGALMAATFVLSAVNRWREGGAAFAIYATTGIAGSLLFAGAMTLVGGAVASTTWLTSVGLVLAATGVLLAFAGLVADSGSTGSGVAQAVIEMFDTVLRLGSNIVSFTRLAAFGLTHAVISGVVWDGTTALWGRSGPFGAMTAVVLFTVGNLVAFALGALVGAIQALRLEYYELFSRLMTGEGRPFEPWHLPVERSEPT